MGHGPNTNFFLRLASIVLDSTDANAGAATKQLTAPIPKDAGAIRCDRDWSPTYVWASSDETKATVDQNGLVTKVANGTTNITAAITLPRHLGGATITSNNCVVTIS